MRCLPIALLVFAALSQDSTSLQTAGRLLEAGDNEGAFHLYQQALSTIPESAAAGDLAIEISSLYYAKSDSTRARFFADRAVAIHAKASGPQATATARALEALALALHIGGDYKGATPHFEAALQVFQQNLGPNHEETIRTRNRLALNLLRAGDMARARQLAEQSLAAAGRLFGPHHILTLDAHRYLGQILMEMGDYPGSREHQLLALAALEHQAGSDSVEVADTLMTMGNTAHSSGHNADARRYFERGAAIYEAKLGPHNTRLGGALDNLGQSLVLLKQYSAARLALNRALEIQTRELGPTHPWTANVLQSLAKLETAEGHFGQARRLYEQNLSIWREKLGPEHPFTLVSMTQLSNVLAHLQLHRDSLNLALNAADIRRDNILMTVRTVDERQALEYAGLHTASVETALSIAVLPDASAQDRSRVWDALIRSRALVLDEMSARYHSIHQISDPQVETLAQAVAAGRAQIAKLVLQGPGKSSLAVYTQSLEAKRRELENTEDRLAVVSDGFRHEREKHRAGFAEVRAALAPGSALVAFRRYERQDFAAAGAATASYVAFVLAGPAAGTRVVPLGSAAHIDRLVKRWREEIDRERTSLGRAAKANEESYRVAAAALRQAVWAPLRRYLGVAQRVYIVPDGALQLVNFAALPSTAGHYLAETGPLLHILSAERDLTGSLPPRAGNRLLAVANPAFEAGPAVTPPSPHRGASPSCADFASVRFGSIPGSRQEVEAILEIWKERGWQSLQLTGKAATESAVKNQVSGNRVVHLATHGFFLAGTCGPGSLAAENPLLRSGLALAGANRRSSAASGDDDGILTAEEVASLNMDGAEWVVLSGCDTGIGDSRAGEGVLGLRRAFQEAGARTLIGSLWPVDDQGARQWMAALYRARFLRGLGTAEAVRAADLEQLRARRAAGKSLHPFYWAGFVAVGDWR